jgi:hypothetical protein
MERAQPTWRNRAADKIENLEPWRAKLLFFIAHRWHLAGLPDFQTLVFDGWPDFQPLLLIVINMVGRAIAERQAADEQTGNAILILKGRTGRFEQRYTIAHAAALHAAGLEQWRASW